MTTATTASTADPLRDIHKAIRAELFAVTTAAGRCDPADALDRRDVAQQVGDLVETLAVHAGHEDEQAFPLLTDARPELTDRLAADHVELERGAAELVVRAAELVEATEGHRRIAHQLYLDLAAFTGAYLTHQDLEERVAAPLLLAVVGPERLAAMERAIAESIPEAVKVRTLAVMLPALNVEERVEVLGGMRVGMPAPAFDQVWGLAASVLPLAERTALAGRLGLA